MQNPISAVATVSTETVPTTIAKPLQLATALVLGLVFLFGAGFVQTSAVHNAAHDVRHSLSFPCH